MDFTLDGTTGGGDSLWDSGVSYVKQYPNYALAAIIGLSLIVIYYAFYRVCCKVAVKAADAFNPGQTMMYQDSDQVGTGNRYQPYEHAVGDRGSSAFAQQVQSGAGGQLVYAPGAAGTPGSLAYQVLNSPDFNCAKRDPVSPDAWSWMNGVAHEQATGRRIVEGATDQARPRTASDLSKIMAGY